MRRDDPWTVLKEVPSSSYRTRVVGARHGMRADVPPQGNISFPQRVQHASLDRSNIGDRRCRVRAERVTHDIRNRRRWNRHHYQADIGRTRGVDDTSTQTGGNPGMADLVIA